MANIVQIVGDGRPSGGTTVVFSLSRALAQMGHDVTIISQKESILLADAAREGLGTRSADFSRRAAVGFTAMTIRRHVAALEPDIVHAHGARAGLPVALAVSARNSADLLYTIHGFHFVHAREPLRFLTRTAEAICMARAACTIFVSKGDRLIAEAHGLLKYAPRTTVITNAVEVDPALRATPKCFDIGWLGRLHYQKNPLILVDILKSLRPLRPSLRVIGAGELHDELRSQLAGAGLENEIEFCGQRSRSEALRLVASCRILLLPSRWEGHPLAALEAMHLGLPIVASDVPGTDEIVVEGVTGFLVSPVDVSAYAARLRQLLGDAAFCRRMGQAALERSMEHSFDRMASAHLELYFSPGH